MYWTETAIARHLHGRFYQLQQRSLGTFQVVDLNETEEAEEPQPPPPRIDPPVRVIEPRKDGGLWLDDIATAVCAVFGVTKLELKSPRRSVHLVAARQVFFWLAKTYTACSFPLIGAWCGGKDHSTVLYAVGKITAQFERYRPEIESCVSRLGVSLPQQEAA